MWELDCEESWAPKNWCFWTVVLEKTPEGPLDYKEIQQVHSKGDQSWVFIASNDAEAETPVLWPPHAKLTYWKRLWCWEGLGAGGKGDDRGWDGWMASSTQWTWVWVNSGSWWWTGRPGCCNSWGRKESDMTERLNWTELNCSLQVLNSYLYLNAFFQRPPLVGHPIILYCFAICFIILILICNKKYFCFLICFPPLLSL